MKYLVQQVDPHLGITDEETFETKDEAETCARFIRGGGFIAYLWRLDWLMDIAGIQHRVRKDGETFLPWRDFS